MVHSNTSQKVNDINMRDLNLLKQIFIFFVFPLALLMRSFVHLMNCQGSSLFDDKHLNPNPNPNS